MSIHEFLRQRAVNIAVSGQYALPKRLDAQGKPRTFACRTSRVSPFRMLVSVPVVGKIGDRLTPYFADFGNLEGVISDTIAGAFLLELAMDTATREKFASKLSWLDNRQKNPAVRDGRKQARVIPANPHSTLTLGDGSVHNCFVIDMSVSGAAVSAEVQPPIGTPLAVGACIGRVVRLLPDGFAVQFVVSLNPGDLERRIIRPMPPPTGGAKLAPRSHDAGPGQSRPEAMPAQ